MKKTCAICKRDKSIHFFSKTEWERAKTQRCTECRRVKNPTGGGTEYWRMTMKAVMA